MSVTDLRSRRVPLPWVCAGVVAQLAALVLWACLGGGWRPLAMGTALGALSALVQLLLATVRPGALGFGDVTATALVGLAVGSLGLEAAALWWLLMGMLGLMALGLARLRARMDHMDHMDRACRGGRPDRTQPTPMHTQQTTRRATPRSSSRSAERQTGARETDASVPFAPVILAAGVLAALSTLV